MSETIDNRVVQMEFDNKNFEQGVAVSLKTLDKLKKALELDKAVDSLQRVDQAINKFDSMGISRISQSLTNLEARFSAMGTLGARVLENLADKAVQMSARMLQSIFVAPVSQGMGKYDEMMNSKQTMKAALGEDKMGDIDESLSELQSYSDETSYSFATMTGALANFVSAGQKDLPKTTKSIKGIANAAAKAGIGISRATPAFNAFSKAIGAGKMTLMQWQSLELMNFTTEEFRQRMIDAGIAEGTLKKGKNGKITAGKKVVTSANIRETLSQGWATSAVMQRVLNQYADDSDAYDAAQKAKSFQDVWDAVMDAVSSSWMETYKLIFGDLEEAITFFTDLANGLYDWVDVFNSRRNQIISDWRGNGPEKPVLQSTLKIKEGMEQLDGYIEEHAESFKTSFKRDGETIEQYYKDGKYWQRKTSGKGKKKKVVTEEITPDQLGETYYRDGKHYRKVQFEYDTDEEGKPLRKGKKRIETREIEITTDPRSVAELQAELEGIEDGRTYLINGFAQMGSVVIDITKRIDDAFGKVFGDNLGSKLLEMSRNFSEFGDSVSNYFNPLRLDRIENTANAFFSVLDWGRAILSALLSPVKSLAVAFAPVMDAFLYLSSAISTVIWRWHDDGKGFEQIASWGERLTAAFSPITDLFGKIAAKIRSVADTVVNKTMNGEDSLGRFGKILDGIGAAGNIAVTVISWLANGFSNLVVFLAPIAGAIGDAALSVLAGIGQALSWLNASGKVPEFLGKVTEKLKNFGGSLVKWFSETTIGKKLSSLKSKISGFFSILKVDPEKAWGVLKRFGKDTKQALIKAAGPIAKVGSNVAQWFGNTALGKKLGKFKNTIGTVWNAFKKDPKRTMEVLKNWGVAYKKKFLAAVNNNPVLKAVREKVGGFFQTIKEKAPQAWENLKKTATSIKDSIVQSEGFQRVKGAVSGFFDRVKEGIQNFDIKEFPGKVRSWLGGIKEQFEKSAVGQWIISKWNWLKEKLGGLLEKFGLNEKLENIKKSLLDFKDRLGIVFDGIGDKMNTFFTLLKEDPSAAMQYLKDIFAPITEPIEAAFTNLKDWFVEKKNQLVEMFRNLFSGGKGKDSVEGVAEDEGGGWLGKVISFLESVAGVIAHPLKTISEGITTVQRVILGISGAAVLFAGLRVAGLAKAVTDWINMKVLKKKGLFEGLSDTMVKFAQALLMIAGAFLIVSLIPQDRLVTSAAIFGGSLAVMTGLAAVIKKFKLEDSAKSIAKFGMAMLALAGAVLILTITLMILNKIKWPVFLNNLVKLGLLLVVTVGAMWLFSKATSKLGGIQGKWKPIIAFAAAALILAVVIKLLSKMEWEELGRGILGLGAIVLALWGVAAIIQKYPLETKKIFPYIVLAVLLWGLSAVLGNIGSMGLTQILKGILGMAAIVVAMWGVGKAAEAGGKSVTPTLMISYILFAVAMWGLADALGTIGKMKFTSLLKAILGMAVIIAGLAVLSKVSKSADIKGVLVFALIAGILILALHALLMVSKESKGIDIGGTLVMLIMLTAAIAALAILSKFIGASAHAALVGFGVIALGILMVGAAVAIVGKLISNSLVSFSQAMFVFGSCMGSYSDMVADTDQTAMDASLTFLANFVDTAIYVAQSSNSISIMEDFGNVMYMLGADISLYNIMVNGINVESMNASLQFAKDFAESSTVFVGKDYTGVNDLGNALRNFGANMRLFSRMTTKLDLSGITSMQTLADELNSVYTKLSGVTDIGDLSTAIANIGAAIRLYYKETSGIETDGEVDLSNLSTIFTELAGAMPDQTAISDISAYAAGGDNDLTNFALGMTAIGTAFKDLGDNVSTITQATVTKITDIIGKLTDLRTAITPETVSLDFMGIFHKEITKNGEDSDPLGQFATDITALGSALGDFGASLSGAAGENGDFANFNTGIDVLTKIKDLNSALSKEESGFSLDFLGVFNNRKSQLGEFAEDIELLGGGIKKYVDSVKDIDVGKMLASFGALSFFTILHKNMDNIGGVFSWLAGEKNLGVFGAQISTLGDGLAQYMDKISGKTFDNAAASVAPLSELAKIQNTIQSTGGLGDLINGVKDLGAFGTDIGSIGEGLGKFADGISGKTDVLGESEKALTPIDALVDVQNKLPNGAGNLFSMFGSLTDFAGHFEAVGSGLGKFADGIKGKDFSNSLAASQLLSRLGKVQNELYKPKRSLTDFGNDLNVLGPALGVVIDAFAKGVTNREDVMALLNDISAFEQGLTTNNWGLDTFGERLESFGTHLMNFMTDTADFSYEKVSDTIRVLRNLVNLSGSAQKNSAKDGAKAIREMLGVFNDTSWGKQTVATMAAQTATDFITSFNSSVEQLQNGTGEVAIPTLRVRPVLDTSGIETGVGEVNGLLGGIDTSALSLQISAIMEADAANNQNIITRLDLANSYLASIINDNGTHTTTLGNDIQDVYRQIGDLATAMTSLKIWLDSNTLIGYLYSGIDRAIGEDMTP